MLAKPSMTDIDPNDLLIEVYPLTTSGFQTRVPTGIRVYHKPTKASVTSEHLRNQYANKKAAMAGLRALLEVGK